VEFVTTMAALDHGGGPPAEDRTTAGTLNAAIARAVVRVHREQVGRGPTKAQAFFHHNIVVVVMRDVMTQAERSLAETGRRGAVREVRRQLQTTMRPELIAAVEELTGATVDALLSDDQLDPDVSAQVFVMDRPVPVTPA
jgi:uncharacterized protein YbcI